MLPLRSLRLGWERAQLETIRSFSRTHPRSITLWSVLFSSCYPWTVLGLPPVWYKSTAYRSRAVIDPRGVLREFGLQLDEDVEVRVWDSTAELRYFVLPERPAESEN